MCVVKQHIRTMHMLAHIHTHAHTQTLVKQALYARYQAMAEQEEGVEFVGRLANYKYFNMDQTIENALLLFEKVSGIPQNGRS